MARYAQPCIACGRELENVSADVEGNQPYGGTAFTSHGHYGSTAYDPLDGHYIEINVCDVCLVMNRDRVREGRSKRPVMEDGVVVGWDDCNVRPTPWRISKREIDHVISVARKERLLAEDEEENE